MGSSPPCLCPGSKDRRLRETRKHRTASCTSEPSSVSTTPWRPLYALQTSRVLHTPHLSGRLTSTRASNQPESLEAATHCSAPPQVLWRGSLYGFLKNAAQLHSVRWTKAWVSLAETPPSRVLSRASFGSASSLPPVSASAVLNRSFRSRP